MTVTDETNEAFAPDFGWVPLLSGRPLSDFTPPDYKEYVRSLYKERRVRARAAAKKKPYKLTVRRLKKGALSVTTKRNPAYITPEEYAEWTKTFPENELFIALRAKGVVVATLEEVDEIRRNVKEIPW